MVQGRFGLEGYMKRMEDMETGKESGTQGWGSEEEMLDFTRRIALKVRRRYASHLELSDLISWGYVGLLEARKSQGASGFSCWRKVAYWRTYGAMMDGARRWSQESHGKTLTCRDRRRAVARGEGDISLKSSSKSYSFQRIEEEETPCNSLVENHGWSLSQQIDEKSLHGVIGKLSLTLPVEERVVLELLYVFEMGTREVAELMGRSKSWVSRQHHRSIKTLRKRLDAFQHSERQKKRSAFTSSLPFLSTHSLGCSLSGSSTSGSVESEAGSSGVASGVCATRFENRGRSARSPLSKAFLGPCPGEGGRGSETSFSSLVAS